MAATYTRGSRIRPPRCRSFFGIDITDIEATSRQLLHEEIDRIIADAKAASEAFQPAAHAAILLAAYPGAHYSIARIAEELVLAATAAGLGVEIAEADPLELSRRKEDTRA